MSRRKPRRSRRRIKKLLAKGWNRHPNWNADFIVAGGLYLISEQELMEAGL